MKRSPRVSVVIPVRNGERFIEESVSSLYSQTYQDFELLIIDNGSTDRTREVCEPMLDKRTRFVGNPGKQTIADALNIGIGLATGDYIARLDSDDVAEPNRLERQVDFLDRNPLVGIVGSWMQTFGERRRVWKYPVMDDDIRLSLFFRSPFAHPAVMFRTFWLNGGKGYYDSSFDLAEDLELWTRICRLWQGANIPQCLTLYRTHPAQATRSQSEERESCVARIVEKYSFELGLRPPPLNSLVGVAVWWAEFLNNQGSRSAFAGANFRANIVEHSGILCRRILRGVAQAFGLLDSFLQLRNFFERRVPKSRRH